MCLVLGPPAEKGSKQLVAIDLLQMFQETGRYCIFKIVVNLDGFIE